MGAPEDNLRKMALRPSGLRTQFQRDKAMKTKTWTLVAAILYGFASLAGTTPMTGTIISEQSVDCGTKNKGKKSSTDVVCQQYVVHTTTTEYQIRQPKPKDQAIIPANTSIQFKIDKDKMKFKANGRDYEFLIVGTSTLSPQSK
jgi:hypothetical protein